MENLRSYLEHLRALLRENSALTRSTLSANIEGDESTAFIHIADYVDTACKEFADDMDKADNDPTYVCDIRVPASKDLAKLVEDAMFSEDSEMLDPEHTTLFRSIVGKLAHAVVKCRVDIAYTVGMLSRAQSKPTLKLLHAALHVLKYLKGTRRLGLKFEFDERHSSVGDVFRRKSGFHVNAISDADWAVRHSTSGFISFACGAPVGYASKKQKSIALSSTEAEIFAASLSGLDILYLLHLLDSIRVAHDGPVPLLVDNEGAVSILSTRTASGHAKHIERRHLHLRELKENKVVDISFVPTVKNVSDILTKALDPIRFEMLRSSFMHYVP